MHDTSVEDSRPRELHSSTARKTAPNPEGAAEDGRPSSSRPDESDSGFEDFWQPVAAANNATTASITSAARTTTVHAVFFLPGGACMANPPIRAPSVTRGCGRTPGTRGALGQVEVVRRW
jgi:hypothetical protein